MQYRTTIYSHYVTSDQSGASTKDVPPSGFEASRVRLYRLMAAKTLSPEDTVFYRLYLPGAGAEQLTSLAVDCTHFARAATERYVWHYEKFGLSLRAENTKLCPSHLHGSVCFRDNIEDEWLIVYLLFKLSKRHPKLVISVCDGDGEFLLIEAALHLPRWVKPETAENRVFIAGGSLHIIPKPRTPAEITELPIATPTVRQAIKLVGGGFPTEASAQVQAVIRKRIDRFSESNFKSFLHHTHVYLPCPAAHVMSHDPQLISAAVHALCDRDPADMRACRRLNHFSPARHPSIMINVTFSRLLYAQLLHQNFTTPRNSGFQLHPAGSRLHKPCDLGVKLTCGLEILASRVSGEGGEGGEGVRVVEDDPHWSKFLQSLKDNGYFQNEIEGSKLHQKLMTSAKEYFSDSIQKETTTSTSTDNGQPPTCRGSSPLHDAGRRIAEILRATPYNSEEELKQRYEHLQPPDDESWLEISPEQLDDMMRRAAGYLPREEKQDSEADLQSMVLGMKSFVDKVSSHKGAEFPWSGEDVSGVDFNPDSFMESVHSLLGGREAVGTEWRRQQGEDDSAESEDALSISDSDGVMSEGGEGGDRELLEVMQQMDEELAETEVGKSFEKLKMSEPGEGGEGGDVQPVDVDFNLVKNLLESYSSQEGGVAGPASNILQSLGVHIPADHPPPPPSTSSPPPSTV